MNIQTDLHVDSTYSLKEDDQTQDRVNSETRVDVPKENPGLSLHELFNRDQLHSFSPDVFTSVIETEPTTSSFWSKLHSLWATPPKDTTPLSSPATVFDTSSSTEKIEPISPIPALDPPKDLLTDQLREKGSILGTKEKNKGILTDSEMTEALALMSSLTLEVIMSMIYKTQMKLAQENAQVAHETLLKQHQSKKQQGELLSQIKEALAKDQKIAEYLKTAQNITTAATFICGLVFVGINFNLLGVAPAVIKSVAMLLSQAGPAAMIGLLQGSKTYYKRRSNLNSAKYEEFSHQSNRSDSKLDDTRQLMLAIADSSALTDERFTKMLKRKQKLIRRILAKT